VSDAQHRQVRVRIIAHHIGIEARVIIQAHLDLVRTLHDMTVGQQVAVRREKKARTAALHRTAIAGARGGSRAVHYFDEGYRRRGPLQSADHRAGVGIEQRRIIAGPGCITGRIITLGVVGGDPLGHQHILA